MVELGVKSLICTLMCILTHTQLAVSLILTTALWWLLLQNEGVCMLETLVQTMTRKTVFGQQTDGNM